MEGALMTKRKERFDLILITNSKEVKDINIQSGVIICPLTSPHMAVTGMVAKTGLKSYQACFANGAHSRKFTSFEDLHHEYSAHAAFYLIK